MEAYSDRRAVEILIKLEDRNILTDNFDIFKIGCKNSSYLKRVKLNETKIFERDRSTCFVDLK